MHFVLPLRDARIQTQCSSQHLHVCTAVTGKVHPTTINELLIIDVQHLRLRCRCSCRGSLKTPRPGDASMLQWEISQYRRKSFWRAQQLRTAESRKHVEGSKRRCHAPGAPCPTALWLVGSIQPWASVQVPADVAESKQTVNITPEDHVGHDQNEVSTKDPSFLDNIKLIFNLFVFYSTKINFLPKHICSANKPVNNKKTKTNGGVFDPRSLQAVRCRRTQQEKRT